MPQFVAYIHARPWKRHPRGWITNGVETRNVFKDQPIPDGWRTGRNLSKKE